MPMTKERAALQIEDMLERRRRYGRQWEQPPIHKAANGVSESEFQDNTEALVAALRLLRGDRAS